MRLAQRHGANGIWCVERPLFCSSTAAMEIRSTCARLENSAARHPKTKSFLDDIGPGTAERLICALGGPRQRGGGACGNEKLKKMNKTDGDACGIPSLHRHSTFPNERRSNLAASHGRRRESNKLTKAITYKVSHVHILQHTRRRRPLPLLPEPGRTLRLFYRVRRLLQLFTPPFVHLAPPM